MLPSPPSCTFTPRLGEAPNAQGNYYNPDKEVAWHAFRPFTCADLLNFESAAFKELADKKLRLLYPPDAFREDEP